MHRQYIRCAMTLCAWCMLSVGAVAAVCLCQPQSQSSLQQWIKELQLAYPYFRDATIVYNIKTANNTTSNLLDTSHSTPKSISGT